MPGGREGTLIVASDSFHFLSWLSFSAVRLLVGSAWPKMSCWERPRLLSTPYLRSWPSSQGSPRRKARDSLGCLAVDGMTSALPPTKLTGLWLLSLAGIVATFQSVLGSL